MNPRRSFLVLLAVVLGSVLVAGTATAHAQYVSSTPESNAILPIPPTQVTITLSETIQPGSGTIRVETANGTQIERPPVTISPDGRTMAVGVAPGSPGVFTVTWTAISAVDGHFTAGSFAYAIQNKDGSVSGTLPAGPSSSGSPVSPAEVGLRFASFLGLAVALGVAVIASFMWIPAGLDPDIRALRAYGIGLPILLNLGRIAAFAFTASMAGLWVLATGLEGNTALAGLTTSPYVQSVGLRLGLGVVLFALFSQAFARSRRDPTTGWPWAIQGSVAVAVAALVAGSFGTHAAADTTLPAIGVAADAAHLAGVGLWLGGLAAIVAVRHLFRDEEAAPLARIILGRFSYMAAYAVGLVLVGGLVLTLLLVGTWDGLFGNAYGWVVLGKITLFAPMVALGAYNRYWLIPKTVDTERPEEAVRHLVSNVRYETALGVAILVLAGLLTSMPAVLNVAAGNPANFAVDSTVDGTRMHLEVYPYPRTPDIYVFTIFTYYASNGTAYLGARNGTLRFTLQNSTLRPLDVNLSGPNSNHFFVSTTALSQPGLWRVDASFQRVGLLDVRATFYVRIQGSG
ncbi:MAG: CopD family protein [Thermoplasmata archaeon]|nr:CopD family protein [Thermoplasmata archaeon]